jgi:hypothetical protein
MSHGVKIVIGLAMAIVLLVVALAYAFFRLVGP